jgi:hypothetical protein
MNDKGDTTIEDVRKAVEALIADADRKLEALKLESRPVEAQLSAIQKRVRLEKLKQAAGRRMLKELHPPGPMESHENGYLPKHLLN